MVCAVATVAGVALLFMVGLSRPDLLVEDGAVENLSAAGFAAASTLALSAALLGRVSLTFRDRGILAATGGLSLLLFLSEISFGARIFDTQMPRMRGGGEFDGGHDIVILIFRQLRDTGHAGTLAAVIGGGFFLAAAIALLFRFRQKARMVARHILSRAFEFRLALALGMLASAVTLDVIPSYKASILEEVLEFCASVMLVLSVSALLLSKGAVGVFAETPGREPHLRPVSPSAAGHAFWPWRLSREPAKAGLRHSARRR